MGQLNATRVVRANNSHFSALDAADNTLVQGMFTDKKADRSCTDGGTAGAAVGEQRIWSNTTSVSYRVKAATVTTPVNVTANGTNYGTFFLYRRSAAGGSQATVASFATDTPTTDDLTAHVQKALTLVDANAIVAPGEQLLMAVTKAGSGVAIASATAAALYELALEPVT